MKLTTFKNGSRLAIPAIFAALFLVASTVTLYYYSATLSKKGLYAIAGTQENYSWSIAKFSIKLAEFDTFVEQQSHAPQVDNDNLRLRFEILYSRFYVLETVSESTQPLYAEPGYPEVVKQMRLQMDRIDKLLDSPKIDFGQVFAAMKAIKPYAIEMANLTDHAEVKQRTAAYEDYIEKRHIIFYGLVIVMFSVIALIAITLIVFRQQRLTIRQQAKAIEAEKATRTKNAFLGAIGHELRTSLQSVMSAIDVLVNTRVSAEHADTFQRLETAAQQIESQMKDLTDYAHLDSGMMELRIVPFDAQKLIAETANEIATLTRKEQVKLSCEVECSHLLVHSDPADYRQPADQRLQIHRKRQHHAAQLPAPPTGRQFVDHRSDRHRHRYRKRPARSDLQTLYPVGSVAYQAICRRGDGAGDRARPGDAARRHHHGVQRNQEGQHLYRQHSGADQ